MQNMLYNHIQGVPQTTTIIWTKINVTMGLFPLWGISNHEGLCPSPDFRIWTSMAGHRHAHACTLTHTFLYETDGMVCCRMQYSNGGKEDRIKYGIFTSRHGWKYWLFFTSTTHIYLPVIQEGRWLGSEDMPVNLRHLSKHYERSEGCTRVEIPL